MNEQEITEKLKHIGFTDAEVPGIMRDVGEIIYGKVTLVYLSLLSNEQRSHITSIPLEEQQRYLADHAGSLPSFSQSQFDAIHDDTWRDYFRSVG